MRADTKTLNENTDAKQIFTENDIVTMLNFLIDNIYVEFGGIIFQQVIEIPMGTNAALCLQTCFSIHMNRTLFNNSNDLVQKNNVIRFI